MGVISRNTYREPRAQVRHDDYALMWNVVVGLKRVWRSLWSGKSATGTNGVESTKSRPMCVHKWLYIIDIRDAELYH
jgi:hypothetical protein